MKWLLLIAGTLLLGIVLLATAAWLVGRTLPPEHEASVSRDVSQPVSQVASRVRDVPSQPRWRPGVKGIDVVERSDTLLRYVERGPNGAIPFAFRETVRDRTFTSTIDSDALAFGGTWTIDLEPLGASGTRVTITERGVVRSPVFRAMARYVFGHTRTIEQYLAALAAAA